jgi:5-carboxymethyl-2-hydroxymuconate isomerase
MKIEFQDVDFRKKIIRTVSRDPVPVGTVYCIGRNYRKHIEEMKSEDPVEPLIFTKPPSAVCQDMEEILLPAQSRDVHYEVELALVIGRKGKDIPREDVYEYIIGSAVALDLTMRDIQSEAKKKGTPWAIAKGFDYSCPISKIYPEKSIEVLSNVELELQKNGQTVQRGNTSQMIFKIDYLVSYLSTFFTLQPGDIVLTGTPEGVGPVRKSDILSFRSSFSETVSIRFK